MASVSQVQELVGSLVEHPVLGLSNKIIRLELAK
jgi:hypothetical protein